MYVVTM